MARTRKPTKPRKARTPRKGKQAGSARSAAAPGRGRVLAFVTGNAGKVAELSALVAPLGWSVAQDKRGYPELQADTLEEVCSAGADHLLASGLKPPFLLEDSGLFVAALRGFPGVYSRHALDTVGNAGLLKLLRDVELELRSATFQSCLMLVDAAGRKHAFHGACRGRIAERAAGANGFGFDPVFVPDAPGADGRTFAEMDAAAKNRLSHRGAAVRALAAYLAESAKT